MVGYGSGKIKALLFFWFSHEIFTPVVVLDITGVLLCIGLTGTAYFQRKSVIRAYCTQEYSSLTVIDFHLKQDSLL
jgi:hypothetical protein